jgi:glucan phosphoethanolaminetransferase (alkaline phosphatase superfamily)
MVLSRFSRLDVRLLLPTLFLTPIYIVMLFLKGVNSEFFFLGVLFSLLINLLFWKNQIREYEAAAKKPTVRYVSKIVLFFVFLSLILFLSLPPMVFLSYTPSSINSHSMYSFIAATWILTMWGTCLQLFYWEKKNHMKIHIKNENGFQKTYAIGEKEG